jgi:hypothetical protein
MKMIIFWDVAPCSQVDIYRRFRDACHLYYQGDDNTRRSIPEYVILISGLFNDDVSSSEYGL